MVVESTKLKLDNMLTNYHVYATDWLDVLVNRVSGGNMDRELLENCRNPENNLSYYIKDPDIVKLLTMCLVCKPYKFENPNIIFENGLVLNIEFLDTTVIFPYLIINGDFAVDTRTCQELTEHLGLSKTKSNIEFIEDNIPNNDYWKQLVNKTNILADDANSLVKRLKAKTEELTNIRNYYANNIDKTCVECKGDDIKIFNGKDSFTISTYELTYLDPKVENYTMEWFGNDLWFFNDNHEFVFALNKIDALKAFHFASSISTPYSIMQKPRILARSEKPKETTNYIELSNGVILPRNLFAEALDKPRRVVSVFSFTDNDYLYKLYYSHNMVIAETEVANGRNTSTDI